MCGAGKSISPRTASHRALPIDCLIAALALDYDVPLLHADRDFDAIAQATSLQIDQC